MSGVTGFKHDIFISYAHLDNKVLEPQMDGWVKQFFLNLELMLTNRFGRPGMVKIWLDKKKLAGNTMFDKSIADTIKDSAVIISLNSMSYKASDYCQQELKMFYDKAKNEPLGVAIGDKSRIIHVLLNNIPYQDWPEELSGTSGFPFHDSTDPEYLGDPLETTSKEFREKMKQLRDALWVTLREFQPKPKSKQVFDKLVEAEKDDSFAIYISEVPDSLRRSKKRIINELEKKNFKIIEGPPPPDSADAHDKATKETITKSQLSIHMLDQYPGREIIDQEESFYTQRQAELALESPVPQMIWMPEILDYEDIEELGYREFLKKIEDGEGIKKPFEFLRGSKATLHQEIINFADNLQKKQEQKIKEQGPLSVLLDTHFIDQNYAFSLSQKLLEHNIQPYVNPQEDDPFSNMNILGERMSQVRKLVLLYGNVSKEWVKERLNAALELIIRNGYPIEDIFIYMAPPHKEADDIQINQRFLKVNVVNSSETAQLDDNLINEFLEDLKTPV